MMVLISKALLIIILICFLSSLQPSFGGSPPISPPRSLNWIIYTALVGNLRTKYGSYPLMRVFDIEVKDSNPGKVLALNGEDVVLDDKTKNLTNSQIWIKGPENSEGYFSLKNKEKGKFLTLFIHKVKGERTILISVKGKASLANSK